MIDKDLNEKFCISEFRTSMLEIINDNQLIFIVNVIINLDKIKILIIKSYRM